MTRQAQNAAVRQPVSSHHGVSADSNPTVRQLEKALHILRMKQLVERTKLSRATLYVLMTTDSTFPRKIRLTARSVGWLESELEAWIVSRAESHVAA